jgi:hypothetical protein
MPPLTLTVLASVLQMHGAGATITSGNKGIEDLLAPIRAQLQEGVESNAPSVKIALNNHTKGFYAKGFYTKGGFFKASYMKSVGATPSVRPALGQSGGETAKPPEGGTHR